MLLEYFLRKLSSLNGYVHNNSVIIKITQSPPTLQNAIVTSLNHHAGN